jgi:HEAT repeat protein
VVARLVPILSRLGEDRSMGYMTKLLRHESVSVRRTTIKAIAQTGMLQAAQVFNLIDDPDAEIRRIVLRHLGRSRDRVAEDLLLAYLQNHKLTAAQDGHVIDCFKTLGRCGSSRSVPFLRETLMHRKWMATLRKSADQQGAAIALAALQIPESRQVLEEAGRSIHPGLRSLVREVAQESSHKSKGG